MTYNVFGGTLNLTLLLLLLQLTVIMRLVSIICIVCNFCVVVMQYMVERIHQNYALQVTVNHS